MSSKYTDFFDSPHKEGKNQDSKKTKQVSFDDSYTLPKQVKSRDDVEKGFKDYLNHKEEDRRRGYISPPFEVSKVPSPFHGYHKPKKAHKPIDYIKLKEEMKKEKHDFLIYENYVTKDLEKLWNMSVSNRTGNSKGYKNEQRAQINAKKLTKKSFGLNRTLESIMEEEKSGNNNEKRNVPGFFDYKKDS